MYLEIANNCAKLLIFRQLMFGNNKQADLQIRKKFTKEEDATVEQVKEVCAPGTTYRDASGKEVVYDKGGPVPVDEKQAFIERITAEVLKQVKKRQS